MIKIVLNKFWFEKDRKMQTNYGEKCIVRIGLCLVLFAVGSDLIGWNQLSSNNLPCAQNRQKLLSVLNLLCNTTQNTSITTRDACYGCFFRAGNMPEGPSQIIGLSQCATVYLNNTGYQICASNLAVVALGIPPTQPQFIQTAACFNGYCDFVRCIRRINANILVNTCFLANLINRDFNRIPDRINFYTNMTACVLARSRCNAYNPITGELQQQLPPIYSAGTTNNVGTSGYFSYNALQISPMGDVRIIAFPGDISVGNLFCSSNSNLDQSTYDGQTCLVG